MPNPTGINQYSGGGSAGTNAHPDHGHGSTSDRKAATRDRATRIREVARGVAMKAAMEHGAHAEGYSTTGHKHSDR